MKIYINADSRNRTAKNTEKQLKEKSDELNLEIVRDISEADVVVSIGGDGTFLKSARLSESKPIIGINMGTLGYLTEISKNNIEQSITAIKNRDYHTEERMMLEGEIIRQNGERVEIPPALNEIGLVKNTLGVVRFEVSVNERTITSYTADGILVCTPTGSTAYNLSCGGPIVDPTAEIITLTPVAPHTIINRSIVLADTSTVEIKITELRENTHAFIIYDGHPIEVFSEDTVRIKKSEKITKIIKLEERSFIDSIREKIS